jgi:hypothetical protein
MSTKTERSYLSVSIGKNRIIPRRYRMSDLAWLLGKLDAQDC